jgi:hypothetical protein
VEEGEVGESRKKQRCQLTTRAVEKKKMVDGRN